MDPLDLLSLKQHELRLLLAAVSNYSSTFANEMSALGNEGSANLWLVAENAVQLSDGCQENTWFAGEQSGGNVTDGCSASFNATGEEDFNTFYFYQVIPVAHRSFASIPHRSSHLTRK